ncbi:HlyD family secretion protein [Dyadobacter sp. NIV53]|uniref:HlyD family secretion protein n=1 Tax=Dyadobacter sp. NIV53 TaxID=2861765 RepID=UPI001C8687F7|nr:HlyD family efflux transporter periplasmic adaptor subunit [Dyadobacter sp. NIV53]
MQREIYQSDVIEDVAETYLPQVSVQGQTIYIAVICAVLACFSALPVLRIDVSVQSPGIIRSTAERSELRPLTGGEMEKVFVKENEKISAGQVLFRFKTDIADTKIRLIHAMQMEKSSYISDLRKLVSHNTSGTLSLESPLYRQQHQQFILQLRELDETRQKRKRELETSRNLFAEKVVARQELDDKEFGFTTAAAQLDAFMEKQTGDWQAALSRCQLELQEIQAQEKQLQSEISSTLITAPIAGTISQMAGKYPGSYVQPGELLAIISPDSNLIAECYVSPKDIGFLKAGMKCRMQVDAYDYNQWGMAEGTVLTISNDIALTDKQQAYFKVRCRLDSDHLTMKQGISGNLKKGMTLLSNFVVSRRTLYDLLYDQADDWLNPLTSKQDIATR